MDQSCDSRCRNWSISSSEMMSANCLIQGMCQRFYDMKNALLNFIQPNVLLISTQKIVQCMSYSSHWPIKKPRTLVMSWLISIIRCEDQISTVTLIPTHTLGWVSRVQKMATHSGMGGNHHRLQLFSHNITSIPHSLARYRVFHCCQHDIFQYRGGGDGYCLKGDSVCLFLLDWTGFWLLD